VEEAARHHVPLLYSAIRDHPQVADLQRVIAHKGSRIAEADVPQDTDSVLTPFVIEQNPIERYQRGCGVPVK
jgi:hypothetical protein